MQGKLILLQLPKLPACDSKPVELPMMLSTSSSPHPSSITSACQQVIKLVAGSEFAGTESKG